MLGIEKKGIVTSFKFLDALEEYGLGRISSAQTFLSILHYGIFDEKRFNNVYKQMGYDSSLVSFRRFILKLAHIKVPGYVVNFGDKEPIIEILEYRDSFPVRWKLTSTGKNLATMLYPKKDDDLSNRLRALNTLNENNVTTVSTLKLLFKIMTEADNKVTSLYENEIFSNLNNPKVTLWHLLKRCAHVITPEENAKVIGKHPLFKIHNRHTKGKTFKWTMYGVKLMKLISDRFIHVPNYPSLMLPRKNAPVIQNGKLKLNQDITYWTIADLHLFHGHVMRAFPIVRIGKTIYDMNLRLIERWNSVVDEDDVVFVIGDVSFGKREETIDVLEMLNGHIVFIYGNHDSMLRKKIKPVNGFDYLELIEGTTRVCMMHYPMAVWNGCQNGSIMLHGHSHGSYRGRGRIMDVGYDVHRGPVNVRDTINTLNKVPIVCLDYHAKSIKN